MNLRGKTFWEMEKESVLYVHKNENQWISKPVLAAVVNQLDKNEHELNLAFQAQGGNNPGGEVARKNQLLETFFSETYKLSRKLTFYAKVSDDQAMLTYANLTESFLHRLPETEAFIKCHILFERANEYLPKCAGYEITADTLLSLSDQLTHLEKMSPSIGMITNDRKSAGRSIVRLTAEARAILDKLDDGFEGLIDDENFINGWFAVRKIKGRHRYGKAQAPSQGN